MLRTYRDFHKIKFPVYVLPSDNWWYQDRVLFLDNRVVDEKNMPGATLGVRRLQCGRSDLLPLKKALLDVSDLIHCKTKNFIDSSGTPFTYVKEYSSLLKCYRIKRIDRKETASILWLYDWPTPITIPRPPLNNPEYVRLLHVNGAPWIVYDYVRCQVKDTYRRI